MSNNINQGPGFLAGSSDAVPQEFRVAADSYELGGEAPQAMPASEGEELEAAEGDGEQQLHPSPPAPEPAAAFNPSAPLTDKRNP